MDLYSFFTTIFDQQIKTIVGLLTGAATTWLITTLASYLRFRRFRSVFGHAVKNADDIILSLPQWTLQENIKREPRYQRTSHSGQMYSLYGPSRMLAKEDVKGASLLISLIAEIFNKPAVMVSDGDPARFVDKTAIIFGTPLINFHAAEITKMRRGQPLPIEFAAKSKGPDGQRVIYFSNPSTGEEYYTDEDVDYGVILRASQSGDKGNANYFFIVAGLTDAGTQAASYYLHENWKLFRRKPPEFAIILKVPRATPELVAEVVVET
jgi:hypothetical protein